MLDSLSCSYISISLLTIQYKKKYKKNNKKNKIIIKPRDNGNKFTMLSMHC